ncbi:hypothetical protein [Streptomyces sp. NPDC048269]|uniref:hypothetical protein n=1 Tax=Streptomyces sp. NPDC048269 TaxID=3155753 RepID=UPI00341E2106
MPHSTAEELLTNVSGLAPELALQLAGHIDECRRLLGSGVDMDTVQQHLKDQDVPIIHAILITTRLLGEHPSELRAAREIVECSPARTLKTP